MRKVKLIVHETYQGKRNFAAVFLSNAVALTTNGLHYYLGDIVNESVLSG